MNEAAVGSLATVEGTDRLETFEPLEAMAAIVDVGDPMKHLLDLLGAPDAAGRIL